MIDRRALAKAARLLLFGTLIIVIDLRIEGIDLINDLAGAGLVIIGVAGLPRAVPQPIGLHRPLLVLAGVGLAAAIAEQFDPESVLSSLLAWSNVIGAWLTARFLAEAFAAEGNDIFAAQWSASERLLLWLGIVPIIGLSIVGRLIDAGGTGPGPLAIVTFVLAVLPLLHLLVSLYRTSQPSIELTDGPERPPDP